MQARGKRLNEAQPGLGNRPIAIAGQPGHFPRERDSIFQFPLAELRHRCDADKARLGNRAKDESRISDPIEPLRGKLVANMLPDVNVLLALSDREHVGYELASKWFN